MCSESERKKCYSQSRPALKKPKRITCVVDTTLEREPGQLGADPGFFKGRVVTFVKGERGDYSLSDHQNMLAGSLLQASLSQLLKLRINREDLS